MKLLFQPKYLLPGIALLMILTGSISRTGPLGDYLSLGIFSLDILGPFLIAGAILLVETGVYFATEKYRQWRSIQYLHVISAFIALLASMAWIIQFKSTYRFIDITVIDALFLFAVLGQILFIVNLIAGFIRGKKVLNRVR